jgi:leader peptidase (prepilin peptidase) / N-methyltransferase
MNRTAPGHLCGLRIRPEMAIESEASKPTPGSQTLLRAPDAHPLPNPMTGIFVLAGALFGLTLGSFLNVVVYRTPRHLSVVRPGSFCPGCEAEIASRDNVPVLAWLVLRGRCRDCGEPISIKYPLVEAGTCAVFVGLAATIRPLWGVPGWWALAASLGVAALIENERQSCPPGVTLIGASLGAAALGIGGAIAGQWGPLPHATIGLAAGVLAAAAVAAKPRLRGQFGSGAIAAIPGLGACLGWLGPVPAVIGCAVSLLVLQITSGLTSEREPSHARLATCLSLGLVAAVLVASLRS